MEELEYNINIKITDIEVDDDYFSFDYEIDVNDNGIVGNYSSDHDWNDDPKRFLKILKEEGFALECVWEDFNIADLLKK